MLSTNDVRHLAAGVIASRNRCLRRRPIDEILDKLSATVEQWCDPRSPFRRRCEHELPQVTGFSAAMIQHGLPLMFEPLRAGAIGRLLDCELGDRRRLDEVTGPPLILHVVSGNIPALAATPLALSLAIKSGVMVKPSHADCVVPQLFIESLSTVDAELAHSAAALYWPGGRLDVESAAFAAADLVVASGSDVTIAGIARRVRGRFIGHGHRISFAVVAREALSEAETVAQRLADDVSLWDQHGCLSPQLAYVERGGAVSVERCAELVGRQLARLADELPPRRLTLDEHAALRRFRQEAEWRAVRGEEVGLFASPGDLSWTVVYDAVPAFAPTPLNRTIWIKPIDALTELPSLLAPAREYLEAAGVAAPMSRWDDIATVLTASGVHRVCELGEMQRPDLSWRQGGRPRIAEWLA